ncbi:protein of uncharacterised function DUF1211 [Amycolatopsis camponoti]|uniref:Protein of uncharacterized function DUF1211 n=1 Tax=Amycolatopsis camponoti TaxID=2606593 RepID=A0A6I8M7R4_9PSEU|nr:TMEM175 family protein [Amycolatopsis camponoti]VVJ23864.1 protein of uncharacterised function DUF1211 [Amycolatopsis camponoti]
MSSATSDEDTVGSEARGIAAERLTFFSDAVVAIAITLLALELPLPEGATNAELLRSLGHHQSEYVSFLISFIVIAVHWRAHHRLFPFVTTVRGGAPATHRSSGTTSTARTPRRSSSARSAAASAR